MTKRTKELKGYSTTSASLLKKAINQRIATIGKKYGVESEIYKAAIRPFDNEKGAKYAGLSASGYMKINANVKKDWKDPDLLELIRDLEGSARSITYLRESAKGRIKSEQGEDYTPTESEISEEMEKSAYYSNELAKFFEYIYDVHTDEENKELYPELYQDAAGDRPKPTYDVLKDILSREEASREAWNDKITEWEVTDASRIFESDI